MCLGVLSLLNDRLDSSSDSSPVHGSCCNRTPSTNGATSVCFSPSSDFEAEWEQELGTPARRDALLQRGNRPHVCPERWDEGAYGGGVGGFPTYNPSLELNETRFLGDACLPYSAFSACDGILGCYNGLMPPQSSYFDCYPQMIEGQGELTSPSDLSQGMQHTICKVCGDTASGNHFGVLSCEACKSFFRRSIRANARYACRGSRGCAVEKHTRNRCQYCRLQKCVAMGMRKEGTLRSEGMSCP